jgi:hypothetical protein
MKERHSALEGRISLLKWECRFGSTVLMTTLDFEVFLQARRTP